MSELSVGDTVTSARHPERGDGTVVYTQERGLDLRSKLQQVGVLWENGVNLYCRADTVQLVEEAS